MVDEQHCAHAENKGVKMRTLSDVRFISESLFYFVSWGNPDIFMKNISYTGKYAICNDLFQALKKSR